MYHSGGFIVTVYGLVWSGQYCGGPGGAVVGRGGAPRGWRCLGNGVAGHIRTGTGISGGEGLCRS
jgi:hypothetical protein